MMIAHASHRCVVSSWTQVGVGYGLQQANLWLALRVVGWEPQDEVDGSARQDAFCAGAHCMVLAHSCGTVRQHMLFHVGTCVIAAATASPRHYTHSIRQQQDQGQDAAVN